MKIAVIGAGIFGCSAAIRFSENNYKCDLYEDKSDIMLCASRVNQYRFHQGYHYPRSISTVEQLRKSSGFFAKEYKEAINTNYKHYYSLALRNSNVNRDYYLSFLKKMNLDFKILEAHSSVKSESSQLIIEVNEALIDYKKLKKIVKGKILRNKNINIKLGTKFTKNLVNEYDVVVNCGYGLSTDLLPSKLLRDYKFQLLEKIVVQPPPQLKNLSLVIVDGPFMCIDPIPNTGLSILGNVKLAVHHTSKGQSPYATFNEKLKPWSDIKKVENSRFKEFVNNGNQFINFFDQCKFEYSMVGFRVVLPDVESTDERLTSVRKEGKFIDIFSGKIDTCSWASNIALEYIKKM